MKRFETYPKRGLLTKFNLIKKERDGGSYDKKRDFFTVHWEIKHEKPDNVRLHVETPIKTIDPDLNDLKKRVIFRILNSEICNLINSTGYFIYERGTRVRTKNTETNIENDQSTEVFRVILPPSQSTKNWEEKLTFVDNYFGLFIQNILWEFCNEIKKQFPEYKPRRR